MKKVKASTLLKIAKNLPGIHGARIIVESWYTMPKEEQMKLIQNLMIAGAKVAASKAGE